MESGRPWQDSSLTTVARYHHTVFQADARGRLVVSGPNLERVTYWPMMCGDLHYNLPDVNDPGGVRADYSGVQSGTVWVDSRPYHRAKVTKSSRSTSWSPSTSLQKNPCSSQLGGLAPFRP